MAAMQHSLNTIPPELLENIAFHTAATAVLGPPSALIPLLAVNRHVYDSLSMEKNPHLYARIFASKFDFAAVKRRLHLESLPSEPLAQELKRRCIVLKRLRNKMDCYYTDSPDPTLSPSLGPRLHSPAHRPLRRCGEITMLDEVLWVTYLMMLENDGLNELQLRSYANIEEWLDAYWFDPDGASMVSQTVECKDWPADDERNALAMWLYWLSLDLAHQSTDVEKLCSNINTLKLLALGNHRYNLSRFPWVFFYPTSPSTPTSPYSPALSGKGYSIPYFSHTLRLSPPPLACAAILSYVSLANGTGTIRPDFLGAFGDSSFGVNVIPANVISDAAAERTEGDSPSSVTTSTSLIRNLTKSMKWDNEWRRCLSFGSPASVTPAHANMPFVPSLPGSINNFVETAWTRYTPAATNAYKPGSLEGVWEGQFTYTDFGISAALISGASPAVLERCMVAQHRQTWKLREHYFHGQHAPSISPNRSGAHTPLAGSPCDRPYSPAQASSPKLPSSFEDIYTEQVPLHAGDALFAYFPSGTAVFERSDGIELVCTQPPALIPSVPDLVYPHPLNGVHPAPALPVPDARVRPDDGIEPHPPGASSSAPPRASSPGPPKKRTLFYNRYSDTSTLTGDKADEPISKSSATRRVRDIIVTGEGHSSWGEFHLIGRIRPCDGLISITKEYTNGDRGKWLYRGYLVGDIDGNLVGRWRETMTPPEQPGYEGAFFLSKRR